MKNGRKRLKKHFGFVDTGSLVCLEDGEGFGHGTSLPVWTVRLTVFTVNGKRPMPAFQVVARTQREVLRRVEKIGMTVRNAVSVSVEDVRQTA